MASDSMLPSTGSRRSGVVGSWGTPGRGVERVCYLVATLLVLSGLFHLGVFAVDNRPWEGPLSWRKPTTFGLSFGMTLATVTWVTSHLRMSDRLRGVLLGVFAVDCVLEVTGITLQAWRDVPSHFNTTTPFDSTVAFSLAFGGAVLVGVLGTFAVTAFRGRIDGPPSMRLALGAGFAFLVAGLLAGVAMIVRGTTLVKSGHPTEGYDTAGFLKLFHAVTLHAVLVLPLIAWWLERRGVGDETRRTRIVAGVTAAYVLAALGVFVWSVSAV
jgi:hypothetical protein